MRLYVSGSPRKTRVFHLLMGVVSLVTALAAVQIPSILMFVTAALAGVFGVYNLLGVPFPSAVVIPRMDENSDGTALRFAHLVGGLVAAVAGGALFALLGSNPVTLLCLMACAYSLLGLLLEPYLVPYAILAMGAGGH